MLQVIGQTWSECERVDLCQSGHARIWYQSGLPPTSPSRSPQHHDMMQRPKKENP